MILHTPLGTGRLLARYRDRRLHLLDGSASVLWDLHSSGLSPACLAELLCQHFSLCPSDAHIQVKQLFDQWRQAGLLDAARSTQTLRLDQPDDPTMPSPRVGALPEGAEALRVADRHIGLLCEDVRLRARLSALLDGAREQPPPAQVEHQMHLHGTSERWRLTLDTREMARGVDADMALIATLGALTELGSRPAERLLVIHGAGLVDQKGRGLLLIAPGGSGKTTLAAALNADGYSLLSDDVVPVCPDGTLLSLNLPLCLKPGSWSVLRDERPELTQGPQMSRFGQRVRFLPARGGAVTRPVHPAVLIFPVYAPDEPARVAALSPFAALQRIIEAEAVIRDLSQSKLESLARWLETYPAFALKYPDLEQARRHVLACLCSAPSQGR